LRSRTWSSNNNHKLLHNNHNKLFHNNMLLRNKHKFLHNRFKNHMLLHNNNKLLHNNSNRLLHNSKHKEQLLYTDWQLSRMP